MGAGKAAAALAAAAIFGAGTAAAAPLRPPPGLRPVETLWRADAPDALCAIGRRLTVSTDPFRTRAGGYSWRSELTAEILAPQAIAKSVTMSARRCAEQAAGAAAAAAKLVDGKTGEASFADLLQACLSSAKASRYIGVVTLWIDSDCAL